MRTGFTCNAASRATRPQVNGAPLGQDGQDGQDGETLVKDALRGAIESAVTRMRTGTPGHVAESIGAGRLAQRVADAYKRCCGGDDVPLPEGLQGDFDGILARLGEADLDRAALQAFCGLVQMPQFAEQVRRSPTAASPPSSTQQRCFLPRPLPPPLLSPPPRR